MGFTDRLHVISGANAPWALVAAAPCPTRRRPRAQGDRPRHARPSPRRRASPDRSARPPRSGQLCDRPPRRLHAEDRPEMAREVCRQPLPRRARRRAAQRAPSSSAGGPARALAEARVQPPRQDGVPRRLDLRRAPRSPSRRHALLVERERDRANLAREGLNTCGRLAAETSSPWSPATRTNPLRTRASDAWRRRSGDSRCHRTRAGIRRRFRDRSPPCSPRWSTPSDGRSTTSAELAARRHERHPRGGGAAGCHGVKSCGERVPRHTARARRLAGPDPERQLRRSPVRTSDRQY